MVLISAAGAAVQKENYLFSAYIDSYGIHNFL